VNPRQVELVQQSFARTRPIAAHVAATFYAELFALEPSLRPMFKGDMIVQGDKLMRMLTHVVDGLANASDLLPAVQALAINHLNYGVEARHYALVGTALLRTLRHELGADFTLEAREAWSAAFQLLSQAMCEAAYGEAAAASR
jgi:nitric oxide dioxygenase